MKNHITPVAFLLLLSCNPQAAEGVQLGLQSKLAALIKDDEEGEVKPEDHQNTMLDLKEHQSEVGSMWQNAAEVSLVDTEAMPVKSPMHFDLVGLAEDLTQTATIAQSVQKLQNDLSIAEGALKTHQQHLADIKDLLTRAKGEQKFQLQEVLKKAESHVKELQNTVDQAKDHLNSKLKEVEQDTEKQKKENAEKVAKEKQEKDNQAKLQKEAKDKEEANSKEAKESKENKSTEKSQKDDDKKQEPAKPKDNQ